MRWFYERVLASRRGEISNPQEPHGGWYGLIWIYFLEDSGHLHIESRRSVLNSTLDSAHPRSRYQSHLGKDFAPWGWGISSLNPVLQ